MSNSQKVTHSTVLVALTVWQKRRLDPVLKDAELLMQLEAQRPWRPERNGVLCKPSEGDPDLMCAPVHVCDW